MRGGNLKMVCWERRLLLLFVTASCFWPARAQTSELAAVQITGGRGEALVRPLRDDGRKTATVLFFIAHDCPISNQYAPEIRRICQEYGSKGVAFYVVYVDPELSPAAARRHAREFGYPCPALLDPKHRLVKYAGASITPEAAVFAPRGKRLYRGRIDDRYAGLGRRREHVTSRDLRRALGEVLSGRPVATPTTKAVGCFIPAVN